MAGGETGFHAVELSGVGVDIGGKAILKDVSWEVESGRKWVLLGLNGSGKSTLLRLLSGFGFPSRGRMSVLGETLGKADLRLLRRRVGWVHGDLAGDVPGFMSCRDVVISGAEGSLVVYDERDGREARRAAAALADVGIPDLAPRRFSTLSTGERQRVLIARALSAEPALLLLDEPCLGLDPVAREDFLAALSRIFALRPGLSVVAVTHHVEEIVEGYDGVLLLAGGTVVAQGPCHDVLGGPGVARVFGSRCRVEHADGRYVMRFRAG